MNETLWKHKEKKWVPVNKQAALIARKAQPIFLPPEPPIVPRFEPTVQDLIEAENQKRRDRIAFLEEDNARHRAEQELKTLEARKRQRVKRDTTRKVPSTFVRAQRRIMNRNGQPYNLKSIRALYFKMVSGEVKL